jgi:uncharacterized damage-inducible protein DinB
MTISDPKTDLHGYLQQARDVVLWKLQGLSEYDIRRPLVPTGTNLLGLVKHLTFMEFEYFGTTFGRPSPDELPWSEDDPLTDMFATADETREEVISRYKKAWAHSDATIAALPLNAVGRVPHWPGEHGEVTLHRIMVHMITDSQRHAGQADIIRELVDGITGLKKDNDNPPPDGTTWEEHRNRVERAAKEADPGHA